MYPVYLNSRNKDFDFDTFFDNFISICQEEREAGRALVFAFILYDFENPQIAKVLKDNEYWLSLNAISGKYLTVYSIHYKSNITSSSYTNEDEIDNELPIFSYLTSINDNQNPSISSNKLIEKYFGADVNLKYPAVLFFQTDSKNLIDYTLIELDEQEIEKAFLELKVYIKTAVESLKLIQDDYKGNLHEIFENVSKTANGVRAKIIACRTLKKFTSVFELGTAIVGLS